MYLKFMNKKQIYQLLLQIHYAIFKQRIVTTFFRDSYLKLV